jgi:flagellar hook-basal body complex protein FliE
MVNGLMVPALSAASGQGGSILATSSLAASVPQPGFLDTLNHALQGVSTAQSQATAAEAGFTAGVPGATLAKALVANDRAAVAWNATVAVRNELVTAYQSVMNMQF